MNLFGSGSLWITPTQDATGASIAVPSPLSVGVLQDVSTDVSFDIKKLYGQLNFPVAIGRGKGSISCKAKFAQITTLMLSAGLFGQPSAAMVFDDYKDAIGTTIAATVTPTVPQSGTWIQDFGVIVAGAQFRRVVASPQAGQYTVAAGVYTFNAADVGKLAFIDYQYTATSTVAQKTSVIAQPFGPTPTFRSDITIGSVNGKKLSLTLPNCVSSKFSLATKQDDFIIPEFDFEAFIDPATNAVAFLGLSE